MGKSTKEEVVPLQCLEAGENSKSKQHPISSHPKPKGRAAILWCLYTSNTVSRLLLLFMFGWHGRPVFEIHCLMARHREGGEADGEVALSHMPSGGIFTPPRRVRRKRLRHSLSRVPGSHKMPELVPVAAEVITLLLTACGRCCRENPSNCDCEKNKGTPVAKAAPQREVATFYSPRSHLSRVLGSTLLIISPHRVPDQSMRTRGAGRCRRCIPGARAAPQLQDF